MHDVVVIALGAPLLVGVYKDGMPVETIESQEMTSESLPGIFEALLERYEIGHLIYARGPGSFMGIKISYLFLKTLSITKKIPLLAADAFYFNENAPIKAVGKLFFVKIADKIETRTLDEVPPSRLRLPERLELNDFDADTAPHYGIGAVG